MAHSIIVERLSKQYRIGELQDGLIQEQLINWLKHPFGRNGASKPTIIWALKDVCFEVEEGEVLGIIGRNGAGKSTLLKILSRITYPTSGRIRVNGRVATLLEVGTGFHGDLTGRENVFLNGSILGMTKKEIKSKLDAIVAFAGVDQFIDTPVKRYSSGMFLRLGFSVAAHLDPDILIVDEVLAVGDADFQKKCLETMSNLQRARRTVVFVSHNLAAVENLCSRTIWIDRGQICADGDPKQVIAAYLSASAAAVGREGDLRNIESRRGTGDIRFTKLDFLDLKRAPMTVFRSGDCLVAKLHYEATQRVEAPIFGLEIYTQLGTLVTQVHTYNDGFEIPSILIGSGYVEVELKDVNLRPGRYNVSLFAANLGNLFHDVVEHCAILEIESSGRYGLGRGITHNPIISLGSAWRCGSLPVPDTRL
jgi:homopolymeric O-antigen transport system ATP-binding protein